MQIATSRGLTLNPPRSDEIESASRQQHRNKDPGLRSEAPVGSAGSSLPLRL